MLFCKGGEFIYCKGRAQKRILYDDLKSISDFVKEIHFVGDVPDVDLPFNHIESIMLTHCTAVNSFRFTTDRVTTLSLKDSEVGLQLFPKLETFHYFTSKPKPLALKEFLYLHRKTLKFLSLTNETLVVSVSYLENLKHLTVLGQLSKDNMKHIEEIVKTSQSLRSLILPSQIGYCLTSSLAEALQENVYLTRISLDSGIDYFSVTLKRNRKIAQMATLIKAIACFKLKQHKDVMDCIARDVAIIRKK